MKLDTVGVKCSRYSPVVVYKLVPLHPNRQPGIRFPCFLTPGTLVQRHLNRAANGMRPPKFVSNLILSLAQRPVDHSSVRLISPNPE